MVVSKLSNVKEEKSPEEDPISTIKEKCVNCIRGSNLIKTVIIVLCSGVVAQQVTVSVRKLMNKPITTYTHFDFNKTILYPSITFCREPPYKFDKMLEYGLYAHPRYTSTWLAYNFSATSLDKLWDEITYNETDMFVQYGLDGRMDNVEIKATLGFMNGRCYTVSPKIASTKATRESGYSITLQHSARDIATTTSIYPPGYHVHVHYHREPFTGQGRCINMALQHSAQDIATTTSIYPPGYHVYVHYHREPFTEVDVYNGGHIDYFYVNTGDTIDVKLKVDQYVKIGTEDDPCTNLANYSANECTSKHVWDLVSAQAGCSGPWMKSNLPLCHNYSGMRRLISAYLNTYTDHNCKSCPRFCRSYLYNSFITDRQLYYTWDTTTRTWSVNVGEDRLQTHLYIYFNGMLVSVYEERFNYDWNLFISDLGGSIGFLLGLSVIGLMAMFGKIWSTVIRPTIKIPKTKEGTSSHITGDTKSSKHEEYMKSCQEWNVQNAF